MNKQKNQLKSIVEQARHNKFCAESKDAKFGGEEW